jgi:hypothetical protein
VPSATASGVPTGLRVPVRYRSVPASVVLYLGTVRGGGRLDAVLPEGEKLAVDLPSCPGTCAAMVELSLGATAADLPPTGDLVLDLTAVGADARVGLAAVLLR